jgi:hypothetical protein
MSCYTEAGNILMVIDFLLLMATRASVLNYLVLWWDFQRLFSAFKTLIGQKWISLSCHNGLLSLAISLYLFFLEYVVYKFWFNGISILYSINNLLPESRLMWSPWCLYVCVSLHQLLNTWAEPIFMELGTYIMATERISTAYFMNPPPPSVCVS